MGKSVRRWRKVDTIDLSELEINQCKFVEIGDVLIAVCLEEDKVSIYSVECCLGSIGVAVHNRGPALPPAKPL